VRSRPFGPALRPSPVLPFPSRPCPSRPCCPGPIGPMGGTDAQRPGAYGCSLHPVPTTDRGPAPTPPPALPAKPPARHASDGPLLRRPVLRGPERPPPMDPATLGRPLHACDRPPLPMQARRRLCGQGRTDRRSSVPLPPPPAASGPQRPCTHRSGSRARAETCGGVKTCGGAIPCRSDSQRRALPTDRARRPRRSSVPSAATRCIRPAVLRRQRE